MNCASLVKSLRFVIVFVVCISVAGVFNARGQESQAQDREPGVLFVKKIVFIGNKVIDTETLQKVVEQYIDNELTLEEMSEMADLITITYQERGYILARAYLPEQDIEDGVLKIAIAEGRIGKIRVTGKTHYHDRVVKRFFKEQESIGVVNEDLLQKGLLLSKEMKDIQSEVLLKAGEEKGTVDVVLETQDSSVLTFTAHMALDYNNYGSEFVSKNRYGVNLDITDHLWGSTLNLRGIVGRNVEDTALFFGEWMVPINSYGTKIGVSYLDGDYLVGQEFADLGFEGRTSILGFKATHPLSKQKNSEASLTAGYDRKFTRNYGLDEVNSTDVLDVTYGIFNYESLDRFLGKNIFSFAAYFGGIESDEEYIPSRILADDSFSRFKVNVARIQRIYGYTNAMIRGTGQWSPDRLLPIEMLVIGGYGTVRGHEPSTFIGDSGYYTSAEILFAPPFIADKNFLGQRVAQLAQFNVFFDHGGTFINDAQENEYANEYLSGYGLGARLFYKDIFTFKYDFGIPIGKTAKDDDYYHYFYVSFDAF